MLRNLFLIALVLLFILVGALALGVYLYTEMLKPVDPLADQDYRIVEINPGDGTEAIAAMLYEKGLIKNELFFRLYVRRHELGPTLIAGRYSFNPAMTTSQIADQISRGDVYTETIWFTIPEGFTVEEIAARLEEDGLVNYDIFLALARSPSFSLNDKFSNLQEPKNPGIKYLLEGYLFPDTYEVYSDAGEEDIIIVMLHRMNQVFDNAYLQRVSELQLTLHDVLTIASLVEREAAVDHERARIAGVIYNRLANNQRLEIDATIQYALGETKEFLLYADLEIESPYNTYRNDGLPPGPIAAPGEASIAAALYPEEHDYYYYNYKYDGTGEHFFSYTFQEHLENVRRAEANIQ